MAARDHFSGQVDETWLAQVKEEILDPDLPIVDPHHHLWDREGDRFLVPELLADLASGHDVRATVYEECGSAYREDGPEEWRSLGETEFVAAAAASIEAAGADRPKACAAMVGFAELTLGERIKPVLEAHLAASQGRFRGTRYSTAWDPNEKMHRVVPVANLLGDAAFRAGFRCLAGLGLSFDAWVYHPQLGEVAALAAAFPQTPIVLCHFGSPILGGPYAGREAEVFELWRRGIAALARQENVHVKLGALPIRRPKPAPGERIPPLTSAEIADAWRPWFAACMESFGARRCMFESNFPVQKRWSSYAVVWNACKRLAAGASADEKAALFAGTATRIYRLPAALIAPRGKRSGGA